MKKQKISKFITETQIQREVTKIANKINIDYENKNLLILSVLCGSVVFCSDIIRKLKINFEIDFIKVSSYKGKETTKKVELKLKNSINVKDKDVIVIDDICDTGRTLYYLKKLLIKEKAKSINFGVLINRDRKKYKNIDVKYIGFNIGRGFVVGYGLDYNGKYRGLPYIGILD